MAYVFSQYLEQLHSGHPARATETRIPTVEARGQWPVVLGGTEHKVAVPPLRPSRIPCTLG